MHFAQTNSYLWIHQLPSLVTRQEIIHQHCGPPTIFAKSNLRKKKNSFTLLQILYCRLGNELKQLFGAPDLLVSVQTISSDLLLQQKLFCYYWINRLSFVHIKQETRKQLSVIPRIGAIHILRDTEITSSAIKCLTRYRISKFYWIYGS